VSAADEKEMRALALAARARAYAPYSHYLVGAAIRAGGEVFSGANIENASYGLAVCAERTAALQAVLAGHRDVEMVVVATSSSPPASPCGLCRQTLLEFSSDPARVRVLLINTKGEEREFTLAQLIPEGFRGDSLL
jgi:cytidine deaminase